MWASKSHCFSSHMINKCQENKKLALDSGIQTNQILTNDDEVCIPRLSSILLAVIYFSFRILNIPRVPNKSEGEEVFSKLLSGFAFWGTFFVIC